MIPAYCSTTLADCLESVTRATHGRSCEIIVVESSGDKAAEIVARRFPKVILIQSPVRLSAGAAQTAAVPLREVE